jgi:mannitol/fructose-specific phosphotransferase system IIA component (Ntr-type)
LRPKRLSTSSPARQKFGTQREDASQEVRRVVNDWVIQDIVDLDLRADNGNEAIQTLADRLVAAGYVVDETTFIDAVHAREALVSTELPWNIAMPHARTDAVVRYGIAIGRTKTPFMWNSASTDPTRIVFLLAAPGGDKGSDYTQVLSEWARALLDDDFRNLLMTSDDPAQIAEAVERRLSQPVEASPTSD